jgi:signal transduction histidine kinase/ligand-binding sensor domain-containing protein
MHKLISIVTVCLLLSGNKSAAQNLRFNQVLKNNSQTITDIAQDKLGVFWLSTYDMGLQRFDGINLKSYVNDPRNPNSITAGSILRLIIDNNNIIWMAMLGSGIERFDPATNMFTHFRQDAKDATSLSNDTVTNIFEDHLGDLWVCTLGGLNVLNKKTGKFTSYWNDPVDATSISHNETFEIFEDKQGALWIYGTIFTPGEGPKGGVLNRFDRASGKFIRFLQDPAKPNSNIPGKSIQNIYEDSKNNFWIATDAGLYNMDRSSGKCTRYYPDPLNSSTLSQTPVAEKIVSGISFITEDSSGALWIGMIGAGLNRYDPASKKSSHYGSIFANGKLLSAKDTATGFSTGYSYNGFSSKDGLFWVLANDAIYNLNYNKTIIPFFSDIGDKGANAFYYEANKNTLWVATSKGLLRKDLTNQIEKLWAADAKNSNSVSNNHISTMRADEKGNFWLGTKGGVDKFDPVTEKFIHYKHDPKNSRSIASNNINYLLIDHNKNLWVASDSGISRMDKNTEQFTNYKPEKKDSTLFWGNLLCLEEDTDHNIWISSGNGAIRMDSKTGEFRKYISNSYLKTICVDSKGIVWAGGIDGLYFFDKAKDEFVLFANQQSAVSISNVINIIEDNQKNLWVSTANAIIKINEDRVETKKFTETNGVRYTNFDYNDNYKAADGKLFLGIGDGYYSFYPDQIKDNTIPPQLNISGFKLNDKEIRSGSGGLLTAPIWQTTELWLNHHQNVFSFDFFAVDYITPGDEKYLFMLENYDDEWHDIGNDRRASFFNVPPGTYIFRVKAVSSDGASVEKSIRIIISPPWWRSWWAYIVYGFLGLVAVYSFYRYQKSNIIRKERQRTQQKELAQAKEIEKAYNELKTTQQQLIQSEKMASLGELTAGIAHEIQNPLNFVNNFSEINKELLTELKDEIDKGNLNEIKAIANDVIDNEEKINHHGKRADAIVKGMLQHSRSSSGQKEPTDINALADEYLRLSYHGLRAKDKSFNATTKTDFDNSIGKINIVPQEIGRVILNLINNAFYAVDEKKKKIGNDYEPTVSVSTKRNNGKVEIKVTDNGNGIPQKVLDKIFQPFFTTKPTGQGTGLGLSLSYDIVKAHGGELKVETKEGEGSEFIINLSTS